MPATSPTWVASSCAALITPYSDSASSLDMVDEVAGCNTPIPMPERPSATTTTTSPDDPVSVAKSTMENKSGPRAEERGGALPRAHGHVAGDRCADREQEGPGHRQEADLGHAVAVDLLHEQREQEEAPEVGEAREGLGAHREHEVAAAPVRGRDQGRGERELPPHEHPGQCGGRQPADDDAGRGPADDRADAEHEHPGGDRAGQAPAAHPVDATGRRRPLGHRVPPGLPLLVARRSSVPRRQQDRDHHRRR